MYLELVEISSNNSSERYDYNIQGFLRFFGLIKSLHIQVESILLRFKLAREGESCAKNDNVLSDL